jgi:hypothetical protein
VNFDSFSPLQAHSCQDALFDRAPFAVFDLSLEQRFQVVKMRLVLLAHFLTRPSRTAENLHP